MNSRRNRFLSSDRSPSPSPDRGRSNSASAARRSLMMGMVAQAQSPPQKRINALLIDKTPRGSLRVKGTVEVQGRPGGRVLPVTHQTPLCVHDNELLEALDMSDEEAQDTMCIYPELHSARFGALEYLCSLIRSATSKYFTVNCISETLLPKSKCFSIKQKFLPVLSNLAVRKYSKHASSDGATPTVALDNAGMPLKKKIIHKKAPVDLSQKEGHFLTFAFATANAYDLKSLKEALVQQKLYEPGKLKSNEVGDVVVASAVYSVGAEPREIIFFREGAVVFWNCNELEASNVLEFVRPYEIESYPKEVVLKEKEIMTYVYQRHTKSCHLQNSTFVMVPERDNSLERYTFSHAMVQSARLGAWESRLEVLAASVREHTACMEREGTSNVDKKEVVRKLGELFSLRHRLTVESDLLDTPDFYWEEEQLERLYSATVSYFTIPRRTRVLTERLSHCVELLELLSGWAADRHHVRLEWMIITLILAEVCFELLHLADRAWSLRERRLELRQRDYDERGAGVVHN